MSLYQSRPAGGCEITVAHVAYWLRAFVSPVAELRAIALDGSIVSGYFDVDHIDLMASTALHLSVSRRYSGIYCTLNPVEPGAVAVSNSIRTCGAGEATCARHIARRRWLLIDLDPRRPSGTSATDTEKAKCLAKAIRIRQELSDQGWPMPIFADSGNGYHLLYQIDLPTDDGGLIQSVLHSLVARYDDEAVEIDRKVHNAARITKLYGTIAAKGVDTLERPHRHSCATEIPIKLEPVPRAFLDALGGQIATQPPPPSAAQYAPISQLDLPIEILLPRLHNARQLSRITWSACCPAHDDRNPSLSITESDDLDLLVYCHAHCDTMDVMAAVGLGLSHLFASQSARFAAFQTGRRATETSTLSSRKLTSTDFARLANEGQSAGPKALAGLAQMLNLPVPALQMIGAGWLQSRRQWTLPEFDGNGTVIGICLCDPFGSKDCIPGSKRGLILPASYIPGAPLPVGPLFLAEGASDTVSALSQGLLAIGRPMAKSPIAVHGYLAELLRRIPELHLQRHVIVVGDNDPADTGLKGAIITRDYLATVIRGPVIAALPKQGFKDLREQIISGNWALGLKIIKE